MDPNTPSQSFAIRNTTTKSVTLHPTKAQIARIINGVALQPGPNIVIITGITPTCDEHSIKVDGTGSATITDLRTELVDNPEVYLDIYPDEEADDDVDLSDISDDEAEDEGRMKEIQDRMQVLDEQAKSAAEEHAAWVTVKQACESYIRVDRNYGQAGGEATRPPPFEETVKSYIRERDTAVKELARLFKSMLEGQRETNKLRKEQQRLTIEARRAELRKEKEEQKKQIKEQRKKREQEKEKKRLHDERVRFWPKKVYKVTISLEAPDGLTPATSRRSSITSVGSVGKEHERSETPISQAKVNLTLSYITTSASWSPRYDLSLSTVTNNGHLDFSAELVNTTSETWKETKITLSTSSSAYGGLGDEIPVLLPWHLRLQNAMQRHGYENDNALMAPYEMQAGKKNYDTKVQEKPRYPLFGLEHEHIEAPVFKSKVKNQARYDHPIYRCDPERLFFDVHDQGCLMLEERFSSNRCSRCSFPPQQKRVLLGQAAPKPALMPTPTYGLFGSAAGTVAAPKTSSCGLFGKATTAPALNSGGLIGSSAAAPQSTSGGLFGAPSAAPLSTSSSLFGSSSTQIKAQDTDLTSPSSSAIPPAPPMMATNNFGGFQAQISRGEQFSATTGFGAKPSGGLFGSSTPAPPAAPAPAALTRRSGAAPSKMMASMAARKAPSFSFQSAGTTCEADDEEEEHIDYSDDAQGFGIFDEDEAPTALKVEEPEFAESGLTTTYDLPGLKSLNPTSTKSKHKITKIEFRNIGYSHILVPKLRAAAFLKARLKNLSKITLLKGDCGLTLDGTFLGHTSLPFCSRGDGFTLNLGIDPAVTIVYAKPTVRRGTIGSGLSVFGGNKENTEVFTRATTISNTKSTGSALDLTLLEQIPVSEDERLKIHITEPKGLVVGGAKQWAGQPKEDAGSKDGGTGDWGSATAVAKKGGEVSYSVKINPGKGCKISLEYEVLYPGGERVVSV